MEDPSAHWITLDMLLDRMAKEELSERDRSDVDIDHVNHLTDNSPTDGSELYKQECSGLPVDDKKMDVTVSRRFITSILISHVQLCFFSFQKLYFSRLHMLCSIYIMHVVYKK